MALSKDFHQPYLADDALAIVPLAVKDHFDLLSEEEKLYVHYMSMYALSLAIPKTAKMSVADVILVPPFLVLEFCSVSLALNLN